MSSAQQNGAGYTEKERARQAHGFMLLVDNGIKIEAIAEKYKLGRSTVFDMVAKARAAVAPPSELAKPKPKRPQKMPEAQVMRRAWLAIRGGRLFKGMLTARQREIWVDALLGIRAEAPDGIELTFGGPGDVYSSAEEFIAAIDGTPDDLKKILPPFDAARPPRGRRGDAQPLGVPRPGD